MNETSFSQRGVNPPAHQFQLALAQRPADEAIEEDIRDLVERFNTEADALLRDSLLRRIRDLRAMLGRSGKP